MPDTNSYKPELIDSSKPSLDRTGDFSGIKKPEFYAGVTASGDVTFKLSAAAEFGVRFDDKWEIEPAAAAVVGEVHLTTKFAAGISTTGTCPFTYGLDVGARLFARATAPKMFGWSGGEVNLTDPWVKTIIKGGTCPDLGPIPSRKRSLRVPDHLLIEGRAEDKDVTRNMSGLGAAEPDVYRALDVKSMPSSAISLRTRHISGGHMSSLVKRGGVYGPAFSLPVGEFFCPSLDDAEGMTCEEAYDAMGTNDEGGVWADAAKHKREKLMPTSTIDENAIAAQFHAYQQRSDGHGDELDKRATKIKPVRACGQMYDIANDFVSGGKLNGDKWGWVEPKNCNSFDFGSPLTARGDTQYHTEHILEAQMIDLFFKQLNNKKSNLPDPRPNAAKTDIVSFCVYVNVLWDVPAFEWPGEDTTGGVGTKWTPIRHIAAQYPTKTYHADEFIALESAINTPSKTSAWASGNPWNTKSWTKDISNYAKAKVIHQKMRSTMGSRIYQSHSTITGNMKKQTDRIAKVLDALDSTLLPANRRPGHLQWSKQNLKAEWLSYMKGQYTTMQSKTNSLVNDYLPKMKAAWVTQAEKDKWKDAPGDSKAKLEEKKAHRDFIKSIEDFETKWNGLPAWTNPL
jgi:chitinase